MSMAAHHHSHTSITEYLEGLSTKTSERLFSTPVACLAVFRLLSSLSKQLVMSMLYTDGPLAVKDVAGWEKPLHSPEIPQQLKRLEGLHILECKDNKMHLNEVFREQLKNALIGGGNHKSFGVPAEKNASDKVNMRFLDDYALKKWESILHYMVGTDMDAPKPSTTVLNLLVKARLMEDGTDHAGYAAKIRITNKGFQFLLQDINAQVWEVLLQYIRQNEEQVEHSQEPQKLHI
ncbi:RNA polymerase II transcription factor B 52 kDa subunit, partial [Spiromyces aspiralis]